MSTSSIAVRRPDAQQIVEAIHDSPRPGTTTAELDAIHAYLTSVESVTAEHIKDMAREIEPGDGTLDAIDAVLDASERTLWLEVATGRIACESHIGSSARAALRRSPWSRRLDTTLGTWSEYTSDDRAALARATGHPTVCESCESEARR